MPLAGIYIPTRIWWAKRAKMETNLSLQLRLWYHHGIDSAMGHVPILSDKLMRNSSQMSNYGKL